MAEAKETTPVPLPRELRWFAWGLLLLGALCGFVELLCRKVTWLHLDRDPYINPFLREHYPDFLLFLNRFHYFHSPEFFTSKSGNPFMYPAPVGVVYELFFLNTHAALTIFLGFILLSFVVAGLLFGRALRRRGIAATTAYLYPLSVLALSFPVWFVYKQANMEIVVWILATAGIALFLAGRGYSAAVCFGLAASMKIYPLAYLGLLLIRRQYRQIVVGISAGVVVTLASLWLVADSIVPAWRQVSEGVAEFRFLYMLHKRPELPFDHSLLSLIKLPLHPFPAPERFAPMLSAYLAVVAIAGVLLFFLRVWRLPTINQVLFLAIACILFPPVSFEYTLLHILPPLALLVLLTVDLARRGERTPGLRTALVCFALLLAPLPEVFLLNHRIDGQIKAITLVVLLVIALTKPFALPATQDAR